MLTAEQARELGRPSVSEHIDAIEAWIRESAMAGSNELILFGAPYCAWDPRYSEDATVVLTVRHLAHAGYTVDRYYEPPDRSPSGRHGLRIRW